MYFQVKNLQDIVIHVNPANIPYSLYGLQKLWQERLNLRIECYTHSSIVDLPRKNHEFAEHVNRSKPEPNLPTLKVTIIWKIISSTQLVCAPGTFIPICGEVNIIRYLVRCGPPELGYDAELSNQLEIDVVLDLVHELLSSSTKDQRKLVLRRLSHRLGNEPSFVSRWREDIIKVIAVLSALKQLKSNAEELPVNIEEWQSRVHMLIA